MIFLDAYALIALLGAEPADVEVSSLLRAGDAAISSVNLAETADRCTRVLALPEAEVRQALRTLIAGGSLTVVAPDADAALRAASVRIEHYRRRQSELSLADCFLLAAATPGEDAIATSDPPVAAVSRALGIELIALPDSTGVRP